MKPVRFHAAAELELAAETAYYRERSASLEARLVHEVEAAIRLASEFPGIGAPHKLGTRRVFTKSFPFSIVYHDRGSELVIIAVAPYRRRPTYWRDRVSER